MSHKLYTCAVLSPALALFIFWNIKSISYVILSHFHAYLHFISSALFHLKTGKIPLYYRASAQILPYLKSFLFLSMGTDLRVLFPLPLPSFVPLSIVEMLLFCGNDSCNVGIYDSQILFEFDSLKKRLLVKHIFYSFPHFNSEKKMYLINNKGPTYKKIMGVKLCTHFL